MEFLFTVGAVVLIAYLILRRPHSADKAVPPIDTELLSKLAQASRVQSDNLKASFEPGITITMSTVHDERYTPEYLGFCEMRARQYLRELDNPFEEWVYGYHPDKIEREINTILMADAGNEFALKVKERLPSLRRECETKYILFRTKQRSDRAEAAVTVAAKQRYAKEALQLLEDGIRAGVADADKLRALIPQTSQYIAHVAIEDSIEKAKRFEFKENKKKALEYYRDALYSALNDHIDNDQQREVMDWLRAKIDDLEKGVALEMAGRKVAKRKQKSVDQPYQKP